MKYLFELLRKIISSKKMDFKYLNSCNKVKKRTLSTISDEQYG